MIDDTTSSVQPLLVDRVVESQLENCLVQLNPFPWMKVGGRLSENEVEISMKEYGRRSGFKVVYARGGNKTHGQDGTWWRRVYVCEHSRTYEADADNRQSDCVLDAPVERVVAGNDKCTCFVEY